MMTMGGIYFDNAIASRELEDSHGLQTERSVNGLGRDLGSSRLAIKKGFGSSMRTFRREHHRDLHSMNRFLGSFE